MSKKMISPFIGLASLVLCVGANAQTTTVPQILMRVDENPHPTLTAIEMRGLRSDSVEIRSVASKEPLTGNVLVKSYISGRLIGKVALESRNYPKLDLASMRLSYQLHPESIKIHFRFGRARDCYIGDDGRDAVFIVIARNSTKIHEDRIAECSATPDG
jgi:hypothetical protein